MSTETQEQASDAKKRILSLLAQGKVSVEEAEQLLDAIQRPRGETPQQDPLEPHRLESPPAFQRQTSDEDSDEAEDAMADAEDALADAENAMAEAEEEAREAEEEAREAAIEAEEASAESAAEAQEVAEEAREAATEAEQAKRDREYAKRDREFAERDREYAQRDRESARQQSDSKKTGSSESEETSGPHPFGGGSSDPWTNFAQIGNYVNETVRAALGNLPQGISEFVRGRVHDAFETLEARPSMQTTGWQREFRAADVMKVEVSADNGPIRIRKSEDPGKIKVRVVLDPLKSLISGEAEAQSRLEGGTLFLNANRRTEGFEIELPDEKCISAFSKNGHLFAEGLGGTMALATKNGPLTAKQCHGRLEVKAKNGPVTIESSSGGIQVLGKNGPIRIQNSRGFLRAANKNGPLAVHDHEGYPSAANINGPISISGVLEKVKVEQVNGPVRVDLSRSAKVQGSIAAVNGPATIVLGDHCAVNLVCRTGRGPIVRKQQMTVEEEVPHVLRATRGEAVGELVITSDNGPVVIE